MKVYYKHGFGIFFTFFGIVLVCLNLWLMSKGSSRGMQTIICLFLTVIGITYFTQPYFELRNNEIVLFNKFGMAIRTYNFENYTQLQVLDDKIYLNKDGKSKKIRLSKFMARTNDWNAFIRTITGGDLTNEIHNI